MLCGPGACLRGGSHALSLGVPRSQLGGPSSFGDVLSPRWAQGAEGWPHPPAIHRPFVQVLGLDSEQDADASVSGGMSSREVQMVGVAHKAVTSWSAGCGGSEQAVSIGGEGLQWQVPEETLERVEEVRAG